MDEVMIQRWNEVVKGPDHVWHLGDVTMHRQIGQIKHRVLDRLSGHKRLLLGNHDLDNVKNYLMWFEKIKASHVHDNMLFTHIPIHPESVGRFKAIVHGHTHNNVYKPVLRLVSKWVGESTKRPIEERVPYINVCVEHTDYRPISLEELQVRVRKAL